MAVAQNTGTGMFKPVNVGAAPAPPAPAPLLPSTLSGPLATASNSARQADGSVNPYAGMSEGQLNAVRQIAELNSQSQAQGQNGMTPGPDFMTPQMQKYADQFKASQAAQQQAINAGLLQAMGGLGQRRDAASGVAATMPAAVAAAYDTVAANTNRQNAVEAKQGGGRLSADTAALINQQQGAEKASGNASLPLMKAGITADYSKGATALNNTHMANQAALAQAQQGFDMQMLQAQSQWQQQQQNQQAGFQHDFDMARLQSSLSGGGTGDPRDKMVQNFGLKDYAELTKLQGTPEYQQAAQRLSTGQVPTTTEVVNGKLVEHQGGAVDRKTVLAGLNQQTINALLANQVITQDDLAALYGYAPPATK